MYEKERDYLERVLSGLWKSAPTHPPTCDATEKENDGCERPDELLQKNFVRKLIKEI